MSVHDVLRRMLLPETATPETAAPQGARPGHTQSRGNAAALEDAGPLGELVHDGAMLLSPDVVYLGVNEAVSEEEAAALPNWAAVCDGTKDGTVKSVDGKQDLALDKPEDIDAFLLDAGVGVPRTKEDGTTETAEEVTARKDALRAVMMQTTRGTRDQLAELVQTVQKVERGEVDMERLVISGHHYQGEQGIHADNGMITYDQLRGVMEQFPQARGGVKDLMLSACNSSFGQPHDDVYKKIFPNVESIWGYQGIAPSVGPDERNSSPAHIAAWERASWGDSPAAVESEADQRFRAHATTY